MSREGEPRRLGVRIGAAASITIGLVGMVSALRYESLPDYDMQRSAPTASVDLTGALSNGPIDYSEALAPAYIQPDPCQNPVKIRPSAQARALQRPILRLPDRGSPNPVFACLADSGKVPTDVVSATGEPIVVSFDLSEGYVDEEGVPNIATYVTVGVNGTYYDESLGTEFEVCEEQLASAQEFGQEIADAQPALAKAKVDFVPFHSGCLTDAEEQAKWGTAENSSTLPEPTQEG